MRPYYLWYRMPRDEVLIVGAGPAGSVAALVLARAGVRVRLVDRATFPRPKLCGDSVNPGAMAILTRLGVAAQVEASGLPMHGMLVSGPGGVAVQGAYPPGAVGRSLLRSDLDLLLLDAAIGAGAAVEMGVRVAAPMTIGQNGSTRVSGVVTPTAGGQRTERAARVVIGADGRRSTLAFPLGITSHPRRPRRWAIGAYYEGVSGLGAHGEMHVRQGYYVGVAPAPGGLTNACLVMPERRARQSVRQPDAGLAHVLEHDWLLGPRFRTARRVTPPTVLGPLAVDASCAGVDGLLLAGDAAGFIDPMTGDGLRLAIRGAELAAEAALEMLQGKPGAHDRLTRRRAAEFGTKLRVNRILRSLVAVPAGVSVGAAVSRVVPSVLQQLIRYAGDVQPDPT